MAGQLTTEQLLLLNNLMYMSNESPLKNIKDVDTGDNYTIRDFLSDIDIDSFNPEKEYGLGTTSEEWKDIITAVRNDEQLMQMEIIAVHTDTAEGGGKGVSAVFADPDTKEAVVAFKGTVDAEWKDNFVGGGPTDAADGVSTPQQENALEWYQSLDLDEYDLITVTGHSKGGNKAKYITVLDDSVDRCVSFDGQGFSDEFIEQYEQQIGRNQNKVTNHNIEGDYVNMLLNNIGETTYYKAHNIGRHGFLENHCPNTFLEFNGDGTFKMQDGTRSEVIAEVDKFLNSYLRTLSGEEKAEMLELIGTLAEMGFNEATIQEICDTFLEDENADQVSNLLAYLLEYNKKNPEFGDLLQDFLVDIGIFEDGFLMKLVFGLAEWEYIDEVLAFVAGGVMKNDWIMEKLRKYIKEKTGLNLSNEDLRKLLSLIERIDDERKTITIQDNGLDVKVKDIARNSGSMMGRLELVIRIESVEQTQERFHSYANYLNNYAERIGNVSERLNIGSGSIKKTIKSLQNAVNDEAEKFESMGDALFSIKRKYHTCERRLAKIN